MAKVIVYDVAAEFGGAATVLGEYVRRCSQDKENEYHFVVSKCNIQETDNVHQISLSWVKQSWLHRLYCDLVYMPALAQKLGAERILSLQNTGVRQCDIPQTIYVHNALFFTDYQFSVLKQPKLWVYQHVISKLVFYSLKKAQHIIVQTNWMKDEIVRKCHIPSSIIEVEHVYVEHPEDVQRKILSQPIFFYPANAEFFKNHQVILEACILLKAEGNLNYKVVFTLMGDENRLAKNIKSSVELNRLPISFVGYQDRNQMVDWYRQSILIFPSILETVGLPLMEAKEFASKIIASNCLYAKCALCDYEKAIFFDPHDSHSLSRLMLDEINCFGDH